MSWRLRRTSLTLMANGLSVLVIAGGAGVAWSSASTAPHAYHSTARVKPGPLSGKWSGSYSGSYSGTFTLTWQELKQKLNGKIKISAFNNTPTTIDGTVKGSSITFGTVGGTQALTYSGTVSGNTMSGTWQIKADGRKMGGGAWNASRAS